jgi:hypothetical protein
MEYNALKAADIGQIGLWILRFAASGVSIEWKTILLIFDLIECK